MSLQQQVPGGHVAAASPDSTERFDAVGTRGDDLLLGRLAGGDRQALAVMYHRHADAAYAVARELCGRGAQDIVEGAFLALWRQARAGRVGYARSRLLRITRQRALDRLHETGRPMIAGRATADARPLSLIELSDRDARAALALAPPAERECVRLAYFDGMSAAEISTLTRLPACTVSDRLTRGMIGVRRRLSTAGGPG